MRLKREVYLEQIRPYYDSDIIKVITGVRKIREIDFVGNNQRRAGRAWRTWRSYYIFKSGRHGLFRNDSMNETILNGKLLTWTDRIFKQINIIEGTKKTQWKQNTILHREIF